MKSADASPGPAAEIAPPARVRNLALVTLAGLALYLCIRVLQPFVSVLLWSIVLAVLFAPLRARLAARTGRPNLAAALTLLVAVISVLLPLSLVSVSVLSELSSLVIEAPEGVDRALASPELRARALDLYEQARERFPLVERIDEEQVLAVLESLGRTLVDKSLGLAGSVIRAAVELLLVAFTLFFLLRDGELFAGRIRDLLPLRRRQAERLLDRVVEVLRASTFGVVVVAAVQGILGGAMFALLGLPSPLLWGVVMTLFGMIPLVGTGIVWLPAAIYLLATGRTTQGLVLLAWGALVVATVDNLLRPFLVGQRTRLHELVVFFGVLGGLELFGLVGVFVGPAVFAVAASLVELARERDGAGLAEARQREAAT
ncbi:MAG TPA: AI-2E family transporter [Thermoanaerobaculia bacterium]|nr:AI-2E family transporter [Thermoanaerobaculia bacterium]